MAYTRIIIYFFIIIFTFIKCDGDEAPIYSKCENKATNDKYDCFDRISEDEKDDGNHCCYSKDTQTTGPTTYQCRLLTKDEFDDIDATEEDIATDEGLKEVKIECENQSNIQIYKYKYLILSLLSLIV